MVEEPENEREMDHLLEEVSYALTAARTAGLDRGEEMRAALKRGREAILAAESLAADVVMMRRRKEEED